MLKRLPFYLFRQIATAFLFAGLAVSFVVLFTQSFRMLSFVIDNAATGTIFLQLMGLIIPTFLPLIVPLSLGVGVLFIYYKFAVDSELVVMRAAGVSPLDLARPALTLALIATVFCYLLTMWITPAANREIVELQYKVRDNYSVFLVKPGAFNDLTAGLTFYVRARDKNGALEDLLVHDVRHPEKPVTIMAKTGQFDVVSGVPQVTLFRGKRQEIDRETGRLSELEFDRYALDLQLLRGGSETRLPDPREQTMRELFHPAKDPALRRTTLAHIKSELHQRFAAPLLCLVYTLIALTVILAGDFNRRGMTNRVLLAGVAIIGVQGAMLTLVGLMAQHPWMVWLLYGVLVVPLPVCLGLLGARLRLHRARSGFPFLTMGTP